MPLFGYPMVPAEKFKDMVKCDWLSCAAGGGLSGSGRCFCYGIWWSNNCPCYQEEPDFDDSVFQIEMAEREDYKVKGR